MVKWYLAQEPDHTKPSQSKELQQLAKSIRSKEYKDTMSNKNYKHKKGEACNMDRKYYEKVKILKEANFQKYHGKPCKLPEPFWKEKRTRDKANKDKEEVNINLTQSQQEITAAGPEAVPNGIIPESPVEPANNVPQTIKSGKLGGILAWVIKGIKKFFQ